MADNKVFLSFQGLAAYDQLIKKFIAERTGNTAEDVQEIVQALADYKVANDAAVAALSDSLDQYKQANDAAVEANTAALAVLNGTGEGSVAKKVEDAIGAVVDGADEAFDTLKEIADWISEDETGTAALINRVSANEDAVVDLKAYVDAQDEYYFNKIGSIEEVKISSLFIENQAEGVSAAAAINALEENAAIKLAADQEIADNITIDKSCYIDANGSTFTGTVTVPADAEVVIVNATFSNPVVVA